MTAIPTPFREFGFAAHGIARGTTTIAPGRLAGIGSGPQRCEGKAAELALAVGLYAQRDGRGVEVDADPVRVAEQVGRIIER